MARWKWILICQQGHELRAIKLSYPVFGSTAIAVLKCTEAGRGL